MSKSKSRQPSRQTSGSGKQGGSGAAKQASAANRTTVKASASTATEEKQTDAKSVPAASAATKSAPLTPAAGKSVPAASAATKSAPLTPAAGKSVPAARAATKSAPLAPASDKPLSRDAAKYERRQAERQSRYLAQRRARRNKILLWTIPALIVILAAAGGGFWFYQAHQPAHASNANSNTANNFTPYQEAVFNSSYPPVDNVYCDQLEQSVEHIHVYLDLWIDGQQSPLPANIGIPQDQSGNATCYYWLHVHPQYQNVIHIEAPTTEPFTLRQFIDEWNQQFNSLGFPSQLLLDTGWTIWINGVKYKGDLDSVPLNAHNIITAAYNSPNAKPMTVYNWNGL
jgi:hypothetical protein